MGFDKCNWGVTWNILKRTIPLDTKLLNVTGVQPRTRVDIAAWSRHMAHLWTFATSADSLESNIHVVSLIFNYTQTGCYLDDRHPFSTLRFLFRYLDKASSFSRQHSRANYFIQTIFCCQSAIVQIKMRIEDWVLDRRFSVFCLFKIR